jgi:DNA (cytosine-5)-methyltransferase 1
VNNQTPLLSFEARSVALRGRDGGATAELGDDIAGCLRASGGGGDKAHVLAPIAFDSRQDPVSSTDVFGALGSSSPQAQAVCVTGDVTHTLKAEGFDASEDGTGRGQPIVAFCEGAHGVTEMDVTTSLQQGGGKPGQGYQAIRSGMAVRRLTPRECERLQAFPDDYTLITVRGKPAADGPRYKALGNSMCVYNMRWIGARIDAALRLQQIEIEAA